MADYEEIISIQDMEIIKGVAKKYNWEVSELGSILAEVRKCTPRIQVPFTLSEIEFLDERIQQLDPCLKRNTFIQICLTYGIFNNFKGVDVLKILIDRKKRNKIVTLDICNIEEYMVLKEFTKKYGMPVSNFLRYIALNTSISEADEMLIKGSE